MVNSICVHHSDGHTYVVNINGEFDWALKDIGNEVGISMDSQVSSAINDIRKNGYTIVKGVISSTMASDIKKALSPWLQGKLMGRNNFEGFCTERVYALLDKVPKVAALVEHEVILGIVDAFLPLNYLLSSALAINIYPGETPQRFHMDDGDGAMNVRRPHPPIGMSAIWALDDFTSENGATEIVPGSHKWDHERQPNEREAITVTMPVGSVLVFGGNVFHRGGANRTGIPRLAITPQYCPPYMRQLENMTLAVPPSVAAQYSERVQALLGYSVDSPGFRGHVNGRHPRLLVDPNYKGRKYRKDLPAS